MPKPQATMVELAMTCLWACLNGYPTVTLSVKGKCPPGFPRGELLSVGSDGSRNYAVHPVKVLAWIHSRASVTAPAATAPPAASPPPGPQSPPSAPTAG